MAVSILMRSFRSDSTDLVMNDIKMSDTTSFMASSHLGVDFRFKTKRSCCLFVLLLNVLVNAFRPLVTLAVEWDLRMFAANI